MGSGIKKSVCVCDMCFCVCVDVDVLGAPALGLDVKSSILALNRRGSTVGTLTARYVGYLYQCSSVTLLVLTKLYFILSTVDFVGYDLL